MKELQNDPIHTGRLTLVKFTNKNLTARYVSWLNNPRVVRYSEQRHRVHTLDTCRAYMESFEGTPHLFFAILEINRDFRHVGNISAYIDMPNCVADIGILMGETQVWGEGYGTEAWVGLCDHLFGKMGIRKVAAGTVSVNRAMLRIMDKAGMFEDWIRRKHCLWEGREIDVVHRALFREQWAKKLAGC